MDCGVILAAQINQMHDPAERMSKREPRYQRRIELPQSHGFMSLGLVTNGMAGRFPPPPFRLRRRFLRQARVPEVARSTAMDF